jgi:tRNA nucleotidyltransferase (CCA-adding enzyme)
VNISTSVLKARVPNAVRKICQRLAESQYPSWLVGGSVRDALLDTLAGRTDAKARAGNDWDIATAARPEQVTALFRRVIPTGIQHGTVTVLLDDDKFEVTTLRGETTYSDGRRPDSVYFVDDITADLARRDFTINAIAYDPLNDRLIDPFGGINDLGARTLRAVGVPGERFAEDGLRVLRAARFVATLEVELDADTARAIEPSLGSYRRVSAERVRDEWLKAMKAPRPSRAFEVMREHGLLAVTAPELLESVGCEQNRFHSYDVWGHAMACLDACPEHPILRTSGLFHDVGKPRTRAFSDKTQDYTFYEHERVGAEMVGPILERLRFSNEERERVVQLVRHHLICYDASWTDTAVRRWIRRVTPELVPELYLLAVADGVGKGKDLEPHLAQIEALKEHVGRVMTEGAAFSVKDLAISGKDLMSDLGLRPGPLFGEILRTLLDEVVEDPAKNRRDALLARASEIARGPGAS